MVLVLVTCTPTCVIVKWLHTGLVANNWWWRRIGYLFFSTCCDLADGRLRFCTYIAMGNSITPWFQWPVADVAMAIFQWEGCVTLRAATLPPRRRIAEHELAIPVALIATRIPAGVRMLTGCLFLGGCCCVGKLLLLKLTKVVTGDPIILMGVLPAIMLTCMVYPLLAICIASLHGALPWWIGAQKAHMATANAEILVHWRWSTSYGPKANNFSFSFHMGILGFALGWWRWWRDCHTARIMR